MGVHGVIATPRFLQIDDFLDRSEYDRLLAYVAARVDRMAPSTVNHPGSDTGSHDETFRRSRVDTELDGIWPLFEDRLSALLPHVRKELKIDRFELGSIERQLTVHGDGDFFARHIDENDPGTNGARVITFVYYCHVEPKEFSGGTLRLQCPPNNATAARALDAFVDVEPRANSIIFFPATTSHEVMPVSTAADGPAGLRCTVNGWFRVGQTGTEALPAVTPPTLTMLQTRLVPRLGTPAFGVRPAPTEVHNVLAGVWELRSDGTRAEDIGTEHLPTGRPDFLDLGGLGEELLEHLRPAHEDLVGRPLVPTAAYGLRVYRRGQTLARHVDRCESHVVTSVVVVRQHVDRPWPLTLEVGGRTHDVHLGDGHMVTFESAAIPHARYAPLDGDEYVILQLHYRPHDWSTSVPELIREGLDRGLIDRRGRSMVPVVE